MAALVNKIAALTDAQGMSRAFRGCQEPQFSSAPPQTVGSFEYDLKPVQDEVYRLINLTQGMTGKNRIINGNFKIQQRGTASPYTVFTTGSGYTTFDRWKIETSGSVGSTATLSAQTTGLPTNRYGTALKVVATAAESAVAVNELRDLVQYIEGYNIADLCDGTSSITVSFWHKSTVTGALGVTLGLTGTGYYCCQTFTATSTWTLQKVTFPAPPTGLSINTTTSAGLRLSFTMFAGTDFTTATTTWQNGSSPAAKLASTSAQNAFATINNEYWLFDVQLEKGSYATPYDVRPFGQELALCQRYCWNMNYDSQAVSVFTAEKISTNAIVACFKTPVTMRASPSFSYTAGTTWVTAGPVGNQADAFAYVTGVYISITGAYTCGAHSANTDYVNVQHQAGTSFTGTIGEPYYWQAGSGMNITWSAEL